MKYYVKVTKQVAETIIKSGVPLTMTSDGNCLLYQSELNGVKGVNLNERAANVGGSLVVESDALAEIKGTTDTPASCYTQLSSAAMAISEIMTISVLAAATIRLPRIQVTKIQILKKKVR